MNDKVEESASLPDGWRWEKLRKFLRFKRDFFFINDEEEYQLATVQFHGRGVIPREKLLGKQIVTKQQQRIYSGQLLVAEIDAKLGGFGIVPEELEGAIVSGHYFLYDFVSDELLPSFLAAYIAANILTEKVQQAVRGSLRYAAIRPQDVLAMQLLIPDKYSQKHIASQMDTITKMQVASEKQMEALNALPGKFMREVVNGFAPPDNLNLFEA